jgi:hypothetical protein
MKKKLTSKERQRTVEEPGVPAELESVRQLADSLQQLQAEVRSLKHELQAVKKRSASRIGVIFTVPGIFSLVYSVLKQSPVLAFIGLGLTFWGALFFLVRPIAYVRGSLLNTAAAPLYSTIDRIIKDLNYKGRGLYIPPYPMDMYLPEHLKGLKETIVFISADADSNLPSVEEMATSKFATKNPKGIILIPPGSGLMEQFEQSMGADLTKISLEDFCTSLPQIILENFQLAKDIEMITENGQVHLKTTDSVYKSLYRDEKLKSLRLLGCPLTSAVACAIAKAIGKPVFVQSINVSPDEQTIEALFSLREITK